MTKEPCHYCSHYQKRFISKAMTSWDGIVLHMATSLSHLLVLGKEVVWTESINTTCPNSTIPFSTTNHRATCLRRQNPPEFSWLVVPLRSAQKCPWSSSFCGSPESACLARYHHAWEISNLSAVASFFSKRTKKNMNKTAQLAESSTPLKVAPGHTRKTRQVQTVDDGDDDSGFPK